MAAVDSSKIREHMDVIAADGERIGKVDHLQGGGIKLTKADSPDHHHHIVPLDWIDHVDAHVHLNKTLADIRIATRGARQGVSEVEATPASRADATPQAGGSEVGGSEVDAKP